MIKIQGLNYCYLLLFCFSNTLKEVIILEKLCSRNRTDIQNDEAFFSVAANVSLSLLLNN